MIQDKSYGSQGQTALRGQRQGFERFKNYTESVSFCAHSQEELLQGIMHYTAQRQRQDKPIKILVVTFTCLDRGEVVATLFYEED